MADGLYSKGFQGFLSGAINLASDDIRVLAVDSALYTPNLATHEFLSSIPSGARLGASGALTGKSVVNGIFDANDTTISGLGTNPVDYAVFYKHTGSDATARLIALWDLTGAPIAPSSGAVLVSMPEGGNGIFRIGEQGSTFSPLAYGDNLVLWAKARSDYITLSGADVTAWADLSGNGYTIGDDPVGTAPLFVASDANYGGHAAVQFDRENGDGEWMQAHAAALEITGSFTICVAVKYDRNDVYQKCWGLHAANGDAIGLGCDNIGNLTVAQTNGDTEVFEYGFVAHDVTDAGVYTVVATPRVGVTPGTIKVYQGSTELTLSASTNISAAGFDGLFIGMGAGLSMEGSLAEFVMIKTALNAAQVAELATFVANGKL
jgi:hypothetical protein